MRLRVGDTVLAEDPAKGKAEPERVQAVIDDGLKPLVALDLSDGSTLRVTSNHPFYVDGGPQLTQPGWLQAGQLRIGDRLRTENGRDITVVALHWNVGDAEVYTLTVANDHTFWGESGPNSGDHDFFVGTAQVLVHNSNGPCPIIPVLRPAEQASLSRLAQLPEFASRTFSTAPSPAVDWVDDLGRTYDQIGDPATSQYWASQERRFLQQISNHVAKADYAVLDMTGFTQSQIDTVRQYVDSLPMADQDKIVRLGF